MLLVVTLYVVLVAIIAFAPLRASIIAFLLLSTIDFPGDRSVVGLLNAAKGLIIPLYFLWRLRHYSGHKNVIIAPLAWGALVLYAAIAASWSVFPTSAVKLVGHMAGSLLIAFVFLRATKGGYLKQDVLVPVTVGTIAFGLLCFTFEPAWTGEVGRFTSFLPAQGYASFLAALFCLALCSETLRRRTRIVVCVALAIALIANGSRIWFIGILLSSVLALLISKVRTSVKLCTVGAIVIAASILIPESASIMTSLDREASSNRIVAALSAFYQGDTASTGLGTLHFRRTIVATALERIKESSLSELLLGHGTSSAAVITGSLYKGYELYGDPNRMLHNEWLRVFYEWGIIGFLFWCLFIGSIAVFAIEGIRNDPRGNAKPLLVYLPTFLFGLAGENVLAGAGSAMSVGFLLLIGIASISHREAHDRSAQRERMLAIRRSENAVRAFSRSAV